MQVAKPRSVFKNSWCCFFLWFVHWRLVKKIENNISKRICSRGSSAFIWRQEDVISPRSTRRKLHVRQRNYLQSTDGHTLYICKWKISIFIHTNVLFLHFHYIWLLWHNAHWYIKRYSKACYSKIMKKLLKKIAFVEKRKHDKFVLLVRPLENWCRSVNLPDILTYVSVAKYTLDEHISVIKH